MTFMPIGVIWIEQQKMQVTFQHGTVTGPWAESDACERNATCSFKKHIFEQIWVNLRPIYISERQNAFSFREGLHHPTPWPGRDSALGSLSLGALPSDPHYSFTFHTYHQPPLLRHKFTCMIPFSFFITYPTDWLERSSPKWPILCWVEGKTYNLQTYNSWLSTQVIKSNTYEGHFPNRFRLWWDELLRLMFLF